jgi:hypothetical protein
LINNICGPAPRHDLRPRNEVVLKAIPTAKLPPP